MANIKIALAGEGGQGVQTIAMLLAEAAYQNGRQAIYIPNFGVEQRGGVSIAYVQISDEPIGAPRFKEGDVVVALSDRAIERVQIHVGENTVLVYDNSQETTLGVRDSVVGQQYNQDMTDSILIEKEIEEIGSSSRKSFPKLPLCARRVIGIPATAVAKKEFSTRVFNMVILGAVLEATGVLELTAIHQALEKKMEKKFADNPGLREYNYQALSRGMELVERVI